MHNDFVQIGPKTNPAQITPSEFITTALQKIAENKSTFISRGDNSGTHKKEKTLWQAARINPTGANYLAVG